MNPLESGRRDTKQTEPDEMETLVGSLLLELLGYIIYLRTILLICLKEGHPHFFTFFLVFTKMGSAMLNVFLLN